MPKLKKFKIYAHPFLHLNVQRRRDMPKNSGWPARVGNLAVNIFYYVGMAVLVTAKSLFKAVYYSCYHLGNVCIKSVMAFTKAIVKETKNTAYSLNKRYEKLLEPQFKNALVIFLAIAILGSSIFAGMRLVAKGLALKGQVLGVAINGKNDLLDAEAALKRQSFDDARNKFLLAYQSFSGSQQELQKTGGLLNQLLKVLPQKRDADKLFDAASRLSSSGADMVEVYKIINGAHLSADGLVLPGEVNDTIRLLNNKVNSINENLIIANREIAGINPNSIPKEYQNVFLQMRDELGIIQKSFNSFKEVFVLTQSLFLGDKNVLVLFENNNELRASGGFMGTFGNLRLADGKIGKINISSIYDLDGQLTEKILPPTPILNVNDRWFLRDSNWFADFPETAKKVTSFYEKEGGETPDVIMAITPNLITDLLKITGPIAMRDYNATLNSDNFVEQTQIATTKSYVPLNRPKQLLADFFPVLMQKLSELPAAQWPAVLESLQNNLNAKQVLFYSRNQESQQQLQSFNWAGAIAAADRDYLSIVSSNLGATKTDLFVDQDIDLKTVIGNSGEITNELTITRTNRLPKMENTFNTSYLRIYVPQGSTLVSNSGFEFKALNTQQDQSGYVTDPQVLALEKSSVRDVVSGTTIGTESGKTFFGNWLTVNGGETKVIKLVYRLPFELGNVDRYSLMLQKQIGGKNFKFNWAFDFSGYALEWSNFDAQNLNANSLAYGLTLNRDYFLGAVFRKR